MCSASCNSVYQPEKMPALGPVRMTHHCTQPTLRLHNILASTAVVTLACGAYGLAPYNRIQLTRFYGMADLGFLGWQFLCSAALVYVLALATYYVFEARVSTSKSLRCTVAVMAFARAPMTAMRNGLHGVDRVAVLTTLLKAFFGPFMVMALMEHVVGSLANGWAVATQIPLGHGLFVLFNQHGYWLAMQLILFVDVVIFTVGYLVETPRLNNEIRSVDATLLGWSAALLCYPPFNQLTGMVLGSSVSDFPKFDDPMTHVILNLMLLGLMAIYASASVALGLKASNLTHRGIVARGPYALVRHPAYTAKNMAWWIGSAPLVSAAFAQSALTGMNALLTVAGWSLLYVLRAMTEEDHLRSVDGDYAA